MRKHGISRISLACAGLACVFLVASAGCDGMGYGRGGGSGPQAPPEGGEAFTILLCPPYAGADHVREATEAKRKTEAATGWSGIYVVHESSASSLYMGRYASQKEAGAKAQKVRAWKSSLDTLPFQYAVVIKRVSEAAGPREWDLARMQYAPGYYTVVIAEFFNEPENGFTQRMEMAVENCRDMRNKNIEAYYYHGPTKSLLTIGAFPASAYYMKTSPDGRSYPVIGDERLAKVLKDRPALAVNFFAQKLTAVNPRTFKTETQYTPSYVTAISEFRHGRTDLAPPIPPSSTNSRVPQFRESP
jgi:hypothetical protein